MDSETRLSRLREQVNQAKANPGTHRHQVMRRETLATLIRSTQSPSTEMKILAARNIKHFFKEFPEQEESAINAVYDLCEDQSPEVRIEGYKAITEISKAERRLVKRNADVLLQLLQSDEPDEVSVVKNALCEHIELDPRGALSVLCDQLQPIDPMLDEEERDMRVRVRALVSAFLTGEAMETISRHIRNDVTLEGIFYKSVLGLPSQLSVNDTMSLLAGLITGLNKFRVPATRTLMPLVWKRVSEALQEDLKLSQPCMLTLTRPELEIAQNLVLVHRVVPPLALLQVYIKSFVGKHNLQRLAQSEQEWVLGMLAASLSFSQTNYLADPDVLQCQSAIVAACPYLLELLTPGSLNRTTHTCAVLLRTCLQKKNTQGWTVPPNLTSALQTMKEFVDAAPPQESKRELQKMLMFLLPAGSRPKTKPTKSLAKNPDGTFSIKDTTSQASSSKSSGKEPSPLPPSKKRRGSSEPMSEDPPKLSLLSRLQPAPPTSSSKSSPTNSTQGFSIKGAASASNFGSGNSNGVEAVAQKAPPAPPPPSLLERLNGSSTSLSGHSGPSNSDHKKRKRGQNR